jgi:hypothetical protein
MMSGFAAIVTVRMSLRSHHANVRHAVIRETFNKAAAQTPASTFGLPDYFQIILNISTQTRAVSSTWTHMLATVEYQVVLVMDARW